MPLAVECISTQNWGLRIAGMPPLSFFFHLSINYPFIARILSLLALLFFYIAAALSNEKFLLAHL
jgi:hypothetical protein